MKDPGSIPGANFFKTISFVQEITANDVSNSEFQQQLIYALSAVFIIDFKRQRGKNCSCKILLSVLGNNSCTLYIFIVNLTVDFNGKYLSPFFTGKNYRFRR